MSSQSRFQFYEEVRIMSEDPEMASVKGEVGVISGMSEEDGEWSYAVFISKIEEVWCFDDADLESTGVYYSREDFYSGESIRVAVDANGRSTLIE